MHHLEAMKAFYAEAFGARFYEVPSPGLTSHFAEIGAVTLKLVPIRDEADFEDFPVHQLGFTVPDAEAVIRLAVHHGGRQEGVVLRDGAKVHAAIRDPDGNSVELYSGG